MTPSPEESLDIEALKPCPFCGGEDLNVYVNAVTCCDCGGGVSLGWEPGMQPAVAIKAWNARALAKQQEESGELREKIERLVDWAMKRSIGSPPRPREEIVTFATDQILALLPPQDERGEGAFDPQVLVPFAEFARAILEVHEGFRDFRNTEKLRGKFWIKDFADLLTDRTWDHLT